MHTGLDVFPCSSKAEIEYIYKLNAKCECFSTLKYYVLSNGALDFAVSLILCTPKYIKLFTETVLAFSLHFQHTGLSLEENQVYRSKECKILV
jgi:hypothetical protein